MMRSLSTSVLWKRMVDYYDTMGPEAWEDEVVPLDITSNKYMAQLYTSMIIAKINDHLLEQKSPTQEPFTIIELGVGHGRFSFYLLKTLAEALKTYELPLTTVRYIMTDISEKNIAFWQKHPALQTYIQNEMLDFAFFNALDDDEIHLKRSGEVIHQGDLNQPMFAIGNYLFDTLPHDAFRIKEDKLYETELLIESKSDKAEDLKQYFEDSSFKFKHHEITPQYYDKYPSLNEVLAEYKEHFEEASFLIPIGSIHCIENLRRFSKAPLTLLVADKGDVNRSFFEHLDNPDISLHGSVSMTVNFDALARYAELNQGASLIMNNQNADFQVACLAFDVTYPIHHLRYAFKSSLSFFSPQDLFNLCYSADGDKINKSFKTLDELLALMNLSQWDPSIFYDFHDQILKWLEKNDIDEQQDILLQHGLKQVWDYFFLLEKSRDVPFAIGSIFYQVGEDAEAVEFYKESLKLFGEQEEVYFNLALAYQSLKQNDRVIESLHKALEINPRFQDAKKMLKSIKRH